MSLPNFSLNSCKLCTSHNILWQGFPQIYYLVCDKPLPFVCCEPGSYQLCLIPASSCTGRDSGLQSLSSLLMTFMIWVDPFHIPQSNFCSWLKRSSLDIYSFYRSHSIALISLLPFSEPLPALPFPFSDEGSKTAYSIQGAATTNLHSGIAMCSSIPLLIIPNIGLPFLPVAKH